MVCSEFFSMLDNYENLTENEKSDLNSHSAECESCRNEFEFFKSITNTVSALPCPEPPSDLIKKVNKQLDEMQLPTSGFSIFINNIKRNSYRYASIAACLAVGLVVGLNSKSIKDGFKDNNGVISTTTTETRQPVETEPTVTPAPVAEKKDIPVEVKKEAKPAKVKKQVEKTVTKPKKTAVKEEKNNTPAVAAIITPELEIPEIPETIEAPAAETPAATEPAATAKPKRKSTYTIARGVYYIPETTETPVITEEPAEEVENYSLATGDYQIAIGYYDVPENNAVNKNTADSFTEKLIVSVKDVGTITSYMSNLGAMNSGKGYQMALADFYELLSILETEGISYRYSSGINTGDTIIFSIVTY